MRFLSSIFLLILINNAMATEKYYCIANGVKSTCNMGDNQKVTIYQQGDHYLTEYENTFVCSANGEKSICAQGDGQVVKIDGKQVYTDDHGRNFIIP